MKTCATAQRTTWLSWSLKDSWLRDADCVDPAAGWRFGDSEVVFGGGGGVLAFVRVRLQKSLFNETRSDSQFVCWYMKKAECTIKNGS
jgi:hypothetical protein